MARGVPIGLEMNGLPNGSDDKGNVPFSPLPLESFVDADRAAEFLSVERRQVLAMARCGAIPAYPASLGSRRKHWRFRLSELAEAVTRGLKKPVNRSGNSVDNGSRQSRSSRKGSS